jgi:AAA domain
MTQQQMRSVTLASVTTATKKLPSRIAIHALQKWGKTSLAAQAPSPIFLMTRGEDGLATLIDSGQLPPVAHYPECFMSWPDLRAGINELIVQPHNYKTFVLDTLNGAERLIHEHYCQTKMGGNWTEFDAFQRGPNLAVAEVIELTKLLDRLREIGMRIICLIHSKPQTFKNPEGNDYDRWEPVMAKQSWAILDRWFDMILFGNFEVTVQAKGQAKGKAVSQTRLIMTQRSPAFDAGNRHGLPPEIECGNSPKEAWDNFVAAMRTATNVQQQPPQ